MAKIYVFAGLERCDFVYYLGNILSVTEKTVLIIDNSSLHDLFYAVAGIDEDARSFCRQNITYLLNAGYSESLYEKYDFVLVYQGMQFDHEEADMAEHIYFMPDLLPITLHAFAKHMHELENYENSSLIFRDQTSGKISTPSAAAIMGMPKECIVGSILCDFRDYGMYLSLTHNGHQSIRDLSPSFMEALTYVAEDILEMQGSKEMKGIIKKARKV